MFKPSIWDNLTTDIQGEDFEYADFIFSTSLFCSMKQHGWEAAKIWLENFPNMESNQKEYDEKYTSKGIF